MLFICKTPENKDFIRKQGVSFDTTIEKKEGKEMEKRGIKIFLRFFLISSLVLNIFQIQKNIEFKSKYEECSAEFSPTYKYLDSLTIDSFEREVNSGRRIIIYIGRPDCNDCIVFEPILQHLVNEYNLSEKIKYVNVKELRSESEECWKKFKQKYSFSQTPALLVFEKGKCVSNVEWGKDSLPVEKLLNLLKKNDKI